MIEKPQHTDPAMQRGVIAAILGVFLILVMLKNDDTPSTIAGLVGVLAVIYAVGTLIAAVQHRRGQGPS